MSGVIFGGKKATTNPVRIDKDKFEEVARKVAEVLGISDAEFKQMMTDNPKGIYIYRRRGTRDGG